MGLKALFKYSGLTKSYVAADRSDVGLQLFLTFYWFYLANYLIQESKTMKAYTIKALQGKINWHF